MLAVRASGLVKRYGQVVAVDGLDLDIPSGQFFGLLGPNGSGKTSTIHMLATLIRPSGGTARVAGHDVVDEAVRVRGAIGLVTTHDLALAHIADQLAPRAANVHFEDHLEDGKVVFDYRMRPGVVTKSNALELMRSVGIEV